MNKGISNVVGLIIVAIILMGGIGGYMYLKNKQVKPIACTMDAKQCPDGSAVGRIGPNCEFAECSIVATTSTPTSTIVCTMDAKQCPDGSYVSRIPPKCEFTECPIISKTYNLRDIGPAGGLIFYDKGLYSDGWRYLEAAPSDQGVKVILACDGMNISGADGTAIGTGHQNTHDLIASKCTSFTQLVHGVTIGGYSDWFLPSKDELDQMYLNLKVQGVGGFTNRADSGYWSSSLHNYFVDLNKYIANGFRPETPKLSVRAVRAF